MLICQNSLLFLTQKGEVPVKGDRTSTMKRRKESKSLDFNIARNPLAFALESEDTRSLVSTSCSKWPTMNLYLSQPITGGPPSEFHLFLLELGVYPPPLSWHDKCGVASHCSKGYCDKSRIVPLKVYQLPFGTN